MARDEFPRSAFRNLPKTSRNRKRKNRVQPTALLSVGSYLTQSRTSTARKECQ